MTSLPSGLASISARLDDTPNVRGAVAFGRMVAKRREDVNYAEIAAGLREAIRMVEAGDLGSAIDPHAALAVSAAYRSADRR